MSDIYTVEYLITSLKRRASVPSRQKLFDEDDFLDFLYEEMIGEVVPFIKSLREDYFLTYEDFTIVDASNVAGFGLDDFGLQPFGSPNVLSTNEVLQRATGSSIKDIFYISDIGEHEGDVPRVTYEDLSYGTFGFYFLNGGIKFHPQKSFINKKVRIYFYRRPNRLTFSINCAKAQFFNDTTNTITVDTIPTAWPAGTKLDVIRGIPPFDSIIDNVIVQSIAGNVITVDQVKALNQGDWVCPQYYSPVAQIPYEAYPLLSQLGAIKVLEARGRDISQAQAKYEVLRKEFVKSINPRAENAPKVAVSRKGIWRSSRIYR